MTEETTESRILESARKVFINKGMMGARMQEIADEAGINKALLHYYFRSKEKLFEAVFETVIKGFLQSAVLTINSEMTKEEKILYVIDLYINTISANPYAPQFIISELTRDPDIMKRIFEKAGVKVDSLITIFGGVMAEDKNRARHIIVSMLSLVIFPIVARPLLQNIYFENNSDAYSQFLNERRDFIKQTIIKMLE